MVRGLSARKHPVDMAGRIRLASQAIALCLAIWPVSLTAADHVLDLVATARSEAGFIVGPHVGNVPLGDQFT